MKDRRFHYVDAARGIAVLLVIYGHTFRESMRGAIFPMHWCIGSTSRCCFCSPVLGTP